MKAMLYGNIVTIHDTCKTAHVLAGFPFFVLRFERGIFVIPQRAALAASITRLPVSYLRSKVQQRSSTTPYLGKFLH